MFVSVPTLALALSLSLFLLGDHGGNNEIVIALVDRCSKFVWPMGGFTFAWERSLVARR